MTGSVEWPCLGGQGVCDDPAVVVVFTTRVGPSGGGRFLVRVLRDYADPVAAGITVCAEHVVHALDDFLTELPQPAAAPGRSS